MNKILALIGVSTVMFICVCFMFVWYGRAVPDSLIYSYFGAIGAEGFIMGWIKNVKEKRGEKNDGNIE